ncbi:unnamed protein product, partial [Ectocarpus sp. 12 AP-2014]
PAPCHCSWERSSRGAPRPPAGAAPRLCHSCCCGCCLAAWRRKPNQPRFLAPPPPAAEEEGGRPPRSGGCEEKSRWEEEGDRGSLVPAAARYPGVAAEAADGATAVAGSEVVVGRGCSHVVSPVFSL